MKSECAEYNNNMKQSTTIKNINDLDSYTQQLLERLSQSALPTQSTVITLTGDLGAGKTTLTQHLATHLGITEPVSSPTFVIAKYYDLAPTKDIKWQRLIHIDAYRLDGEPLEPMGFDQLFTDPANLIVIEWPEYIESVLPNKRSDISISINQDESRVLDINQK